MSQTRNLDLDKLRAVAVLMTMLVHAPALTSYLPNFKPWGGVDLFFVISGFIVATTFTASMPKSLLSTETRNLTDKVLYTLSFFCRRFFRLTPAIVAVLVLYFGVGYAIMGHEFFDFNAAQETFAIFTYQYNLLAGSLGEGRLIWHWSLSAEEQFYFLFPFFMFALAKSRHRVLVIISLLILSTFVIRPFGLFLFKEGAWLTSDELGNSTLLPWYRYDAILYGLLLFCASCQPWYSLIKPSVFERSKVSSFIVSAVLLIALAYAPGLCYSFNSAIVTISVLSFLLVWMASYQSNLILPMPWRFVDRILGWIGTRSYGLYLLNVPTTVTAKHLWDKLDAIGIDFPSLPKRLLVLILLFVLAEALYRFVEFPLLKFGSQLSKSLLPKPSA